MSMFDQMSKDEFNAALKSETVQHRMKQIEVLLEQSDESGTDPTDLLMEQIQDAANVMRLLSRLVLTDSIDSDSYGSRTALVVNRLIENRSNETVLVYVLLNMLASAIDKFGENSNEMNLVVAKMIRDSYLEREGGEGDTE